MNLNLRRAAVKAWPRHEMASKRQLKALRVGYIRARGWLGDKYLLAKPVPRLPS